MAGTILINFVIGTVAFLVTLLTALSRNVLMVSFERAFIAFLVFFIFSYIIRWVVGRFIQPEPQGAGFHVDLVTPPDVHAVEEASSAAETDLSDAFMPFIPEKMERPGEPSEPDKIANIIRRLADE